MSISLITSETEHCFLSLLTIWIYSFVKYLSQSSVLCSTGFFFFFCHFLLIYWSSLPTLHICVPQLYAFTQSVLLFPVWVAVSPL